MSPAELHQNAGIFLIEWPEDKVTIRLERIRSGHDSVTAEIAIRADLPGAKGGHLHGARESLTSTYGQRTLAKHLAETCPDVDWRAVLQEAFMMTLAAYRQGEPVIELHSAPRRAGPRWRLEPFLMDNLPSMIYGDGAVGKSVFALWLAALVSCGRQTCGLYVVPGSVLYLDFETSAEEMKERLELIEAGLGEPDCAQIHYRFCCQPLADEIEEIQGFVAQHQIELVIVDSMGVALGNIQGDPRVATVEYFRALRSLRCTTLTIDHVTKDKEKAANPYGSIYKRNLVRNMWEMRKQQEPGENTLAVGLYHRKVNFGPLLRPLGFKLAFSGDALYVTTTDVRDVPELAEGMSLRARIATTLREGALIVKEIADGLSLPEATVRAILNRHEGKAFCRIDTAGKQTRWGLLAEEEDA